MKNKKMTEEKYDDIMATYLHDIYKISYYLLREEKLAYKVTRQTFLEFYKHYKEVKEELIFTELANTAMRLAKSYNVKSTDKEDV